jgi:hypothetical protein
VPHVNGDLDVVADLGFGHAGRRAALIGKSDMVSAGALQFGRHPLLTIGLALDGGCYLLGQPADTLSGTAARRSFGSCC